jgi:hypothetical protein
MYETVPGIGQGRIILVGTANLSDDETDLFWRASSRLRSKGGLMRLVPRDDNRVSCKALAVTLEGRSRQALAIAMTADEGTSVTKATATMDTAGGRPLP